MNCRDIKELLNEYIDNELSSGQMQEVKAHIDSCDVCKKELEGLIALQNNLKAVLKTAAGDAIPPSGALANIKERAGMESATAKKGFWSRRAAPAGILFSLFLVLMTVASFMPFMFGASAPPHSAPILVSDGEGGVMLYWKTGDFEYEQYIDADGNLLWGENGRDITGGSPSFDISNTRDQPQTRYDYYFARINYQGGNYIEVWYSDGVLNVNSPRWESGSILVFGNPEFYTLGYSNVINDGNGGVIIVSRVGDDSSKSNAHSVYAQHIDSQGNRLWAEGGLEIQKVTSSPVVLIITVIAVIIAGFVIYGLYRRNKVAKIFTPISSLILFFTGIYCVFLMAKTNGGNAFEWDYVLDTPPNWVAIWLVIISGLALAILGVKKAEITKWITIPVFIPYAGWAVIAVIWAWVSNF